MWQGSQQSLWAPRAESPEGGCIHTFHPTRQPWLRRIHTRPGRRGPVRGAARQVPRDETRGDVWLQAGP